MELKLMILKRFTVGTNWKSGGNWDRFKKVDKIVIDDNCEIKSEAQLAYYIYKKHGEGRYQVLAWSKGVEGFWRFWLGNVQENGFIRDKDHNKEMEKLKKELKNAKDNEDREMVEEDLDFEREISQEERKMKRRGPIGLIKYTAGVFHGFDELPPLKRGQ